MYILNCLRLDLCSAPAVYKFVVPRLQNVDRLSGRLVVINARDLQFCFLDRFTMRAHKHVKTIVVQQGMRYLARDVYIKFCGIQLGVDLHTHNDLRSVVLLSYKKCYPKDDGPDPSLFLSQTRVNAEEKNLAIGPNGYPARPARRKVEKQPAMVETEAMATQPKAEDVKGTAEPAVDISEPQFVNLTNSP